MVNVVPGVVKFGFKSQGVNSSKQG